MLSEKLRRNILSSIRKIESGDFDFDNVSSLFVHLRDALAKKNKTGYEVLYDIFHSTAHSDRDRGFIFDYSKDIVDSFIKAIKYGGSVSAKLVSPNLNKAFDNIFKLLNIDYDIILFERQIPVIEDFIYNNILNDTKLIIKNEDIESCFILKHTDNHLYVSFKMKPFDYTHPNGSRITGSPTMQFRLT